MTIDGKNVTEEQVRKDDERFHELDKKDQLTVEEKTEFGELKQRYGKRMQDKIDKFTRETKTEKEARIKAEEETERLRTENEELKKGKHEPVVSVKEEFVKIGDKQFYSDDTLVKMIEAGKMTENEAYKYQRNRDREEDRIIVKKKLEEKKVGESVNQIRLQDAQDVLKNYPHFSKTHENFNPEDPLFKLTQEIFTEGYAANPRGLSLAVKRAKEILRMSDTRVDMSDEHNVEDGNPPEPRRREKEVTLDETEKESAERMFRDQINPKTNRVYTDKESHIKALDAKKRRLNKE